jgi:hypothetical protein
MRRCLLILVKFKITNIKVANYADTSFENCDRWFKSKISLLAYDEESGKERKTSMYFLVQANDVKEALIIPWESCKAQWVSIVFQLFRNLYYGCFSLFFWRRRRFGKKEKFNALKQLDLKLQ